MMLRDYVTRTYIITLLTALLLITTAFGAEFTQVNGDPIRGTHTAAAVDIAAVDSANRLDPPIALKGRKTIMVSPWTSGTGATTTIALALGTYQDNIWKPRAWVQSGVLTASSTFTSSGEYAVPSVELATGNWTHVKIWVVTLSTGSVRVEWSAY
jgi:hypothetical protein